MDVITIEATPREPGKKGARAARRAGEVPCVLYGPHVDSVAFKVPEVALKPLIFTAETHRVEVKVNGKKWNCILKDITFHPLSDTPIHADFQVLVKGSKITIMVPVQYHGTPIGQIEDGGEGQAVVHEVEVTCLPDNIPSHIDVDVSHLRIGETIHIGDLKVEGVEFTASSDRTIYSVVAPRVAEEFAPAEEAEGEVAAAEKAAEASDEGEVTE
ncbi:MAG TPA: 50S ribosomal protein L25 [Rhodothermales bacterium]